MFIIAVLHEILCYIMIRLRYKSTANEQPSKAMIQFINVNDYDEDDMMVL